MFIMKQVFIAFLSFDKSLAIKCVSLNNELCMIRPSLIDLNPVGPSYYPFIISLDKWNGSCNVVDHLYTKICSSSQTKDVNVKVFNMLAKIYEAKTLIKHISCSFKYRFSSATYNSNQKWNNDKCQCECTKYITYKKDQIWNPSTCICENSINKVLLKTQ